MSDLILYTTEDGRSQIKLRAQEQTVWLTQLEMAELFDATKQNISLHLKNIFEDGELDPAATVKESLTVQTEGSRKVQRPVILPHGVLFRGGAEERIRIKLLKDGHIDTVIGLPANLFYSTGIPVCILVLKKCKKPDDVLFINATEHFDKGKRQNQLKPDHIAKIIKTYQFRQEEARYSRRVEMAEIEKHDFNLNISRYISTAVGEAEIDLAETHQQLVEVEKAIAAAKEKHNAFLRELGLKPLP